MRSQYAAIDPIVEAWIKARGLTLFKYFADREARFCYFSYESECLQISIEYPKDGQIKVHLWDIETNDDSTLHREWLTSADELKQTLDAAFDTGHAWFKRNIG